MVLSLGSLVALTVMQSPVSIQAFYDDSSYEAVVQKHVEVTFQNACASLGLEGFDSLCSTSGSCPVATCSLTTSEFSVQLVSGTCLKALTTGSPVDLIPDTLPYALFGTDGAASSELMRISFSQPRREVGLWIIDSEINNVQPNGQKIDKIRFIGASGATLFEHDLPGADHAALQKNPNQFFGLISSDPIARIEIDEHADTEEVGIDSLQFGPFDAACGGSFGAYGTGCKGEFTVIPRLTISGCPTRGGLVTFSLADAQPSDAIAVLLFGDKQASVPLSFGCTFLVGASASFGSVVKVAVPVSSLTSGLTFTIPSLPSQTTVTAFAVIPPPPALVKFSATNGVSFKTP